MKRRMKHGGDLTEAIARHGGAPGELAGFVDRDQPLAVANSAASAGKRMAAFAVAR